MIVKQEKHLFESIRPIILNIHTHTHRVSRGLQWFGHNRGTNFAYTSILGVQHIEMLKKRPEKASRTWLEKVIRLFTAMNLN